MQKNILGYFKVLTLIVMMFMMVVNAALANGDDDNPWSVDEITGLTEEETKELFEYNIKNGYVRGDSTPNTSPDGEVTSPLAYLNNMLGTNDTYTTNTVSISGMQYKTCSEMGGHNNCTLTALFNVIWHYKYLGYTGIPSGNTNIYNVIRTEAEKLSYNYANSIGLDVTDNDNLVTNVWRTGFGYSSGSGSNHYISNMSRAIDEINAGRPFIMSLASGYYYNHTVAVYGYREYTNNRTLNKYKFLMIYDGWTGSTRYMAWTNTGASYLSCLTKVIPPTTMWVLEVVWVLGINTAFVMTAVRFYGNNSKAAWGILIISAAFGLIFLLLFTPGEHEKKKLEQFSKDASYLWPRGVFCNCWDTMSFT